MFSFPEKHLPHPFVHNIEEVLEGSWPFGIKLPHVERSPLARQGPTNQHYLNNIDEINVPLQEALDAALQSLHLIN